MNDLTLIVPYYRNCTMLARQVEEWWKYPRQVRVVCVDDGSPEPALPIILEASKGRRASWLELYRIGVDIPWNRGGARNLGALVAEDADWLVHVDIDHILPADAADALVEFLGGRKFDSNVWYRFPRNRVGRADDTRKKDALPDDCEYGPIHPHVDSYLISRQLYWKVGGYDEDFSGSLGGGNPFLRRLEKIAGAPLLLAEPIRLEVYTRSVIKDASDWSLSRDKAEYSKRRRAKEAAGNTTPKNPLRFPWVREL